MGNALRYGLMGAVAGGLDALDQLFQEAKTERLQQARLAEQRALIEYERGIAREDKAADRKYNEEQDEKRHEREREEKLSDYERVRKDALTDKDAERKFTSSESAKQREVYGNMSRFKPTYQKVELPAEMGGGWGYADPLSGGYAKDEFGEPLRAPAPAQPRGAKLASSAPAAAMPSANKPAPAPEKERSGTPAPGEIMDGYRFKGGNPALPSSWERV